MKEKYFPACKGCSQYISILSQKVIRLMKNSKMQLVLLNNIVAIKEMLKLEGNLEELLLTTVQKMVRKSY